MSAVTPLSPARKVGIAGCVAVLGFLAVVMLQPGGRHLTRNLDDVAQAVVPLLVAAPACWWAATRADGRLRRFWTFLALTAASWGLGQVAWCYIEIVDGHTPSGGSVAAVGYLLAPVFGVLAVMNYPGPSLHWATRVRAMVDGLLITSTLLFVAWTIAVDTGALARSGSSLSQRITVLTYPAADIVVLAVLATVAARALQHGHDPLVAVGACVIGLLLGDSLSIYVGLSSTYSTGNVVDVFWFAAFLALAVGALVCTPDALPLADDRKAPVWTEFIAYLPLGLAVVMGVVQIARGQGFDTVEQILVLVSILLLVVRSYLFVTENRDLTARLEGSVDELQWLTLHDPLTGLANRVLYMDRLEQAVSRRQRTRAPVAVAYLDLDDFKDVNDTYGHEAGDYLLRQVATRLEAVVREVDTLARLSGDEFAILLTDGDDVARIEGVLRRMLAEVDREFETAGQPLSVSASIGYTVSHDGHDAETLLRQADEAMYAAKHLGKDRVCRYDAGMQRRPRVEGQGTGRTRATVAIPGLPLAPWMAPRQRIL